MATRSLTATCLTATCLTQAIGLTINKAVPALAKLAWNKAVNMFAYSELDEVDDAIALKTIPAMFETYCTSAPSSNVLAALEKLTEACNNSSSMKSSLLSSCISLTIILACFCIFVKIILTRLCRHAQNIAARCLGTSQEPRSLVVCSTNRHVQDPATQHHSASQIPRALTVGAPGSLQSVNVTPLSSPTNSNERNHSDNTVVSSADEVPNSTEQAASRGQHENLGTDCACRWRPGRYNRRRPFLSYACYLQGCKYPSCYEKYGFKAYDA